MKNVLRVDLSSKKIVSCILIIAVMLFEIDGVIAKIGDSTIEIFEIEPYQTDCSGSLSFPQKCLIVDGRLFYDAIIGFEFVEGYSYKIKVKKTQIYDEKNVPMDRGIYEYRVMSVISKEKVSINDAEDTDDQSSIDGNKEEGEASKENNQPKIDEKSLNREKNIFGKLWNFIRSLFR